MMAQQEMTPFEDMPPENVFTKEDPVVVAKEAGLRYITDRKPGIRRERRGEEFIYIGVDGKPVTDAKALDRIAKLGIPPAWERVWISPVANGHIQATGRDAKGRKQYRYHDRWREARDETKYERMIAFGEALPRIRSRTTHDLREAGLDKEKVLATIVQLLDATAIRIGNEEYARENESYGLTTLQNDHVAVTGQKIHFHFRGKSGKEHMVELKDKRLAQIVKKLEDLPGQELFQYIDRDGAVNPIESDDVNQYLQAITQQDFTAKDFRTWTGTVCATEALKATGVFATKTQAKKNVSEAIKHAAERLGNTPAICRKSYVHPGVIAAYLNGTLTTPLSEPAVEVAHPVPEHGLQPQEAEVLDLLKQIEQEKAEPTRGAA